MNKKEIIQQFIRNIYDMSVEHETYGTIEYVLDILNLDLSLAEKMNDLFKDGLVLVIEYYDCNDDYIKREIDSIIMMLYRLNSNNKLIKISTIETIIDNRDFENSVK